MRRVLTAAGIVLICADLLTTLVDGQLGRSGDLDSEPMQKTEMEIPINSTSVQGVAGQTAHLPCDTQLRDVNDAVTMVLWFKESPGDPVVYSYDARNLHAHGKTKLWSAESIWGSRATFRATVPGYLEIKNVQESDVGEYRCRVDFRNSPSKNLKVNFTIIVPPLKPIIYDTKRRDMSKHLEAYPEGSDLDLTCEVHGGKPLPQVTWWTDNQPINSSYEVKELRNPGATSMHLTNDPSLRHEPYIVIVSRISIRNLKRNHHHKKISCKANNTQLAVPQTTTVTIQLYLKPTSVEITNKRLFDMYVSTSRRYKVECQSRGSKPPATLTWWKGSKQLANSSRDFMEEGVSKSVLEWTPNAEDEGKYLTCRAENRHLPEKTIEDKVKLQVHFAPIVTLKAGSSKDAIKEGDDVLFECNVRSNPRNFSLSWHHGNRELQNSGQSLFLQGINRDASGNYSCRATNSEGSNRSNVIYLHVMFAPVCKRLGPMNQRHEDNAIGPEESNATKVLHLECEVEASPSNVTFHWSFNSSARDVIGVPEVRYTSEHGLSRLSHSLLADDDYGTLGCWASNLVGTSKQPCVYTIPKPVKPRPVQNCTAHNHSGTVVRISCVGGFNGGLPQKFVAVVDEEKFVSFGDPSWLIEINKPSTVKVYAVNAKGASEPVVVEGIAYKDVAKFTGETGISLDISPILIGLGGTATGLGLIVTGVLMALWRKDAAAAAASAAGSPSKPKGPHQQHHQQQHQPTSIATFAVKGEEEDGNPDLIPTTALTNSCYVQDGKPSVYGSLPRRSNYTGEQPLVPPQSTIHDLDYPRAAPNTYYSLQRPSRYPETIVRHTTVHESCI